MNQPASVALGRGLLAPARAMPTGLALDLEGAARGHRSVLSLPLSFIGNARAYARAMAHTAHMAHMAHMAARGSGAPAVQNALQLTAGTREIAEGARRAELTLRGCSSNACCVKPTCACRAAR
ncbi:hypothetical protein M3I53_34480 [Paraburkholderia sp. CNPSo 3272]|uniref:hypothetical protein n=1 Tax=Paraburkholderia sp. CNPSo 3272 TaxID=2940931 RepID=UPI0020B8E762|nr:hypothetical protein [Paraburkholderia sp. CNPSo 3272]MCP3728158.1 hypothetical protein [Paraburkholderia sp. CNPSo 3272]